MKTEELSIKLRQSWDRAGCSGRGGAHGPALVGKSLCGRSCPGAPGM